MGMVVPKHLKSPGWWPLLYQVQDLESLCLVVIVHITLCLTIVPTMEFSGDGACVSTPLPMTFLPSLKYKYWWWHKKILWPRSKQLSEVFQRSCICLVEFLTALLLSTFVFSQERLYIETWGNCCLRHCGAFHTGFFFYACQWLERSTVLFPI